MIDIVIGLVIIGYAISGFRQGLAVGVLSLGGFVLGAVLAMKVVPPLADSLEPGLQRSFVVLAAVLLFAWLGQLGGALLGGRLRDRLTLPAAQVVDQTLGAVAGQGVRPRRGGPGRAGTGDGAGRSREPLLGGAPERLHRAGVHRPGPVRVGFHRGPARSPVPPHRLGTSLGHRTSGGRTAAPPAG